MWSDGGMTDLPDEQAHPSHSPDDAIAPPDSVDGVDLDQTETASAETEAGSVSEVPESWAESDLDRLARQVAGADDHVGISALWRVTMSLDRWWFIAIGPEGQESPAAADVAGEVMLLAFSSGDRARDFAVSRDMIAPEDPLNAIALSPHEVVNSAGSYQEADIDGLIFDAHLTGFSIPPGQLEPVWRTVMAASTDPGADSSATDAAGDGATPSPAPDSPTPEATVDDRP